MWTLKILSIYLSIYSTDEFNSTDLLSFGNIDSFDGKSNTQRFFCYEWVYVKRIVRPHSSLSEATLKLKVIIFALFKAVRLHSIKIKIKNKNEQRKRSMHVYKERRDTQRRKISRNCVNTTSHYKSGSNKSKCLRLWLCFWT